MQTYYQVPGRLELPVLEPRERLAAIRELEGRYSPAPADSRHPSTGPAATDDSRKLGAPERVQ